MTRNVVVFADLAPAVISKIAFGTARTAVAADAVRPVLPAGPTPLARLTFLCPLIDTVKRIVAGLLSLLAFHSLPLWCCLLNPLRLRARLHVRLPGRPFRLSPDLLGAIVYARCSCRLVVLDLPLLSGLVGDFIPLSSVSFHLSPNRPVGFHFSPFLPIMLGNGISLPIRLGSSLGLDSTLCSLVFYLLQLLAIADDVALGASQFLTLRKSPGVPPV